MLEVDGELDVNEIGILRATRTGEAGGDVATREEMTVSGFKLRVTRQRNARHQIDLGSHKAAVARVDAVSGGAGCATPARRAADVVKIVVRIGEPEEMAFERGGDATRRLQRQHRAHVMDVLQRNKI